MRLDVDMPASSALIDVIGNLTMLASHMACPSDGAPSGSSAETVISYLWGLRR